MQISCRALRDNSCVIYQHRHFISIGLGGLN